MSASALYDGTVYHTRLTPRRHSFRYRLFMAYLDLDELPTLFDKRWLWSAFRPNLVWFRRADYMEPHDRPLAEVVRDRVESELGRRPTGSVRVLTHLRTLGYVFNPVTFYFCHDDAGELDAVVAEITNTPWRERHAYVLDARKGDPGWRFAKVFHVSPFFGMEQTYEWRLEGPGDQLAIRMTNRENGEPVFHAGLECARRPLTGRSLAWALVRHPLLTLRIHAAIYWQAARLYFKRTPFFVHPRKRAQVGDATPS